MEQTIETQIGNILRQRNLKLAVAESCTGGLIGHRITNVPGSSDYFTGGVIAYAYEAKVKPAGCLVGHAEDLWRGQPGNGAGDGCRRAPEPGGGYRHLGQRDCRSRRWIAQTSRSEPSGWAWPPRMANGRAYSVSRGTASKIKPPLPKLPWPCSWIIYKVTGNWKPTCGKRCKKPCTKIDHRDHFRQCRVAGSQGNPGPRRNSFHPAGRIFRSHLWHGNT